jgi:hypothetical protein
VAVGDQFFRTPHLKTRDLRFLISSSVELFGTDFSVDFCFFAAGLEVCPGSFLEVFLEVFLGGGVESMSTDMSESLCSAVEVFCFFFDGVLSLGDLGVLLFGASGDVAFLGVV